MIEPLPLELRDKKCHFCGGKVWELNKRLEDGRQYVCKKCKCTMFLSYEECGLKGGLK